MIYANKEELTDNIKTLIYIEDKSIFEKIDFDDEYIYLESLLFAYFNNKNNSQFVKVTLKEILQGYYTKKDNINIEHSLNENDISYIPNLGYYNKEKKLIEPILKGEHFEIIKEVHPLLEKYFVEFSRGHILNANPKHNSVWKEHYKEVFKAIKIIKDNLPGFYKELTFANRAIYLHDNPKILNFTTVETLGMLYFYVIGKNNLIYFIEELIHQGSHNYFYFVVHNRKEYFKIDVDNLIMRDYTNQKWDYRNIYGAFHGIVTVSKRVECFDILLQNNVFSGKEKHELLGRFTDQFSRFRTGLELLNFDEVYTKKGIELYNEYDKICLRIFKKYKKLVTTFDLSNRDVDFRYNDFCKLNPYEDFLKKDKEGYFNFEQ